MEDVEGRFAPVTCYVTAIMRFTRIKLRVFGSLAGRDERIIESYRRPRHGEHIFNSNLKLG